MWDWIKTILFLTEATKNRLVSTIRPISWKKILEGKKCCSLCHFLLICVSCFGNLRGNSWRSRTSQMAAVTRKLEGSAEIWKEMSHVISTSVCVWSVDFLHTCKRDIHHYFSSEVLSTKRSACRTKIGKGREGLLNHSFFRKGEAIYV